MNQDFECPRCGHCCKSDLARVGEVGVWGECEPQEAVIAVRQFLKEKNT